MRNKKLKLLDRFEEMIEKKTIENCENEKNHKHGLESFEKYCARQTQKSKEFYKSCADSFQQTLQILIERLLVEHDEAAVQQLIKGAKKLKKTISQLNDTEILDAMFLQNQNLATICGYNEELIGKMYQVGTHCLEAKDIGNASKIFTFLILLDPGYSSIWISLGIALELEKHWEESIEIFEIALSIDPENPFPFFHKSICYKELGRKKEAKDCLDEALKKALNQPKYTEIAKVIKNKQLKH